MAAPPKKKHSKAPTENDPRHVADYWKKEKKKKK